MIDGEQIDGWTKRGEVWAGDPGQLSWDEDEDGLLCVDPDVDDDDAILTLIPAELLATLLRERGWTCEAPAPVTFAPVEPLGGPATVTLTVDCQPATIQVDPGDTAEMLREKIGALSRPIPLVRLREDDPSMREVTSGLRRTR